MSTVTPDPGHEAEIVERLAALALLAPVPRAEIAWMAARGEVRLFGVGDIVRRIGDPIDEMWVVLAGRLAFTQQKGGAWRTMTESVRGDVVGAVPHSRIRESMANLVARDETTVFALHRSHFSELIQSCCEMTTALVHHLLDRSRLQHAARLNDDRMEGLGRLAAGLAHELNNPASAAARDALVLRSLLNDSAKAARALAGAQLIPEQLATIDHLLAVSAETPRQRSPLEAAGREDDIADWLNAHDLDDASADALAASDIPLEALEQLAEALPAEALGVSIRWLASGLAARELAHEIEAATSRIHHLVNAVRGFTFMDRESVPEEIDIARGLADTVSMLGSKARAKSVDLQIESGDDLPTVHGIGSEINQVWEKLIDNALDASHPGGGVTITATVHGDAVIVRIADTGPGIARDIQSRVFDPFFTTKPTGEGTGLGLDIARRFVHLHRGEIDFTSQPGRTEFRVYLPRAGRQE